MGTYNFVARIHLDGEASPHEVPLTHSASSLAEAQDMLGQAFGNSMRQGYLNFSVGGKQFIIPSERIARIEVEVVE
jgi:hypothetical protein